MPEALPYVRPLFIEEQQLIRRRSGWGTAAVLVVPAVTVLVPLVLPFMGNGPRAIPIAAVPWILPGAVASVLLVSLIFARTITVVEAAEIRLSFRLGPVRLWRRVIPLANVRACELLRAGDPMAARPSWRFPKFKGVSLLKFTGGDTLLMVRGGQPAVVLATGKFGGTLIGSERPAELAEVIQTAVTRPSPLPPFAQT